MTKPLTEKFNDGELEYGYYFCKLKNGEIKTLTKCYNDFGAHCFSDSDYFYYLSFDVNCSDEYTILDVLAPVPTHEELQRLKDKLDFAKNAVDEFLKTVDESEWIDNTLVGFGISVKK